MHVINSSILKIQSSSHLSKLIPTVCHKKEMVNSEIRSEQLIAGIFIEKSKRQKSRNISGNWKCHSLNGS